MCTVIAKETKSRVVVLSGVPCCLTVADITSSIPKVNEANGWFELYEGEIAVDVPDWASWLMNDAKMKALADRRPKCRGKRVFFFDVSGQWSPSRRGSKHLHKPKS